MSNLPHPAKWVNQMTGGLSHSEFRVLSALSSYANSQGTQVYPSKARLQRNTGLSRSTVQRALRSLKESGWIMLGDQSQVSHISIDRRPVVYRLNLEKRWSDEPDPEESVPASSDDEAPAGGHLQDPSRGVTYMTP